MKAVIYAVLSKRDNEVGDDSMQSQIREIEARIDQIGGREVVGVPHTDHGFSGSKRNRGPALEQAIRAAEEAAAEHGQAELWAVASSRFGRGSGRLGEARAVGALFYELRAKGVALRTVHDDEFVTNEMLIGFASRQSSKYTEDLVANVKRSKRRQAESGKHLGGPPPDGWMDVDGVRVHDPDRAPVIRHLFDLADRGLPDGVLMRQLNSEGEGHWTRGGQPWTRRAVQNHVTNAWHAGRVVFHRGKPDEEVFDGQHEPLIDPATFDRIQRRRTKRDLAKPEQHVKGRPAHRHLLAKLVTCGECGSPMFSITSAYQRKDGTRRRLYVCRGRHFSDGTCDFKVNAEAIDTAVLEGLHWVMPKFDEWIKQIEDRHASERNRLEQARDRAVKDRDRQRQKLERAEDRFFDLDDEMQDRLRDALGRVQAEFERSQVRAQATVDALASVPENAHTDKLLDVVVTLRKVISGELEGAPDVGQLNRRLTRLFASFTICRELPEETRIQVDGSNVGISREEVEGALKPAGLYVFPNLRWEVIGRLLREFDPDADTAPPLEWIEALENNPANTHE